jgi:hypothetical protein
LSTSILFQFHKGAIGVNPSLLIVSQNIKFQFHKGAIGVRLKNGLVDANKAVFVPKNKQKNRRTPIIGFYWEFDDY